MFQDVERDVEMFTLQIYMKYKCLNTKSKDYPKQVAHGTCKFARQTHGNKKEVKVSVSDIKRE